MMPTRGWNSALVTTETAPGTCLIFDITVVDVISG